MKKDTVKKAANKISDIITEEVNEGRMKDNVASRIYDELEKIADELAK